VVVAEPSWETVKAVPRVARVERLGEDFQFFDREGRLLLTTTGGDDFLIVVGNLRRMSARRAAQRLLYASQTRVVVPELRHFLTGEPVLDLHIPTGNTVRLIGTRASYE